MFWEEYIIKEQKCQVTIYLLKHDVSSSGNSYQTLTAVSSGGHTEGTPHPLDNRLTYVCIHDLPFFLSLAISNEILKIMK